MLNLDHETVLRLRKAVDGLVNASKKRVTDSRHSLSNMDSQVVLSIHVHLNFKRVEISTECPCACL